MSKENETLYINLFGGPGTSKSTTAATVFGLLKLHGVECELVTEFAKDLVWEERFKTFEDQRYLFGKQHHRLWRLKDKVDIVINDAPLLLSNVFRPETLDENFCNMVVDTINSYNNLHIFLKRIKKYNPNGRNETETQAKQLDIIIKDTLVKYNMEWIEVNGNIEGINEIVYNILSLLELKHEIRVVK